MTDNTETLVRIWVKAEEKRTLPQAHGVIPAIHRRYQTGPIDTDALIEALHGLLTGIPVIHERNRLSVPSESNNPCFPAAQEGAMS